MKPFLTGSLALFTFMSSAQEMTCWRSFQTYHISTGRSSSSRINAYAFGDRETESLARVKSAKAWIDDLFSSGNSRHMYPVLSQSLPVDVCKALVSLPISDQVQTYLTVSGSGSYHIKEQLSFWSHLEVELPDVVLQYLETHYEQLIAEKKLTLSDYRLILRRNNRPLPITKPPIKDKRDRIIEDSFTIETKVPKSPGHL